MKTLGFITFHSVFPHSLKSCMPSVQVPARQTPRIYVSRGHCSCVPLIHWDAQFSLVDFLWAERETSLEDRTQRSPCTQGFLQSASWQPLLELNVSSLSHLTESGVFSLCQNLTAVFALMSSPTCANMAHGSCQLTRDLSSFPG